MYSGYSAAGATAPAAQPAYAQQSQWPLQQQQQATQWPSQPPPGAPQQAAAAPDASNPAATAAWQQAWAHYAQQWQQQAAVGAAAAAAAAVSGGYGQTPTTATSAVAPAASAAPSAWSSYPQQQQQQQQPPQPAQTTVATPVAPPETLESFQKQFDDWERSYNKWLDENRNHPDKEAFKRYEQQWTSWRQQLLAKKELLKQQEQIQIQQQQQQAAHAASQAQWPPLHAPPAPPSLNGMHQQQQHHHHQQQQQQQQQQQTPWGQIPSGAQQPQGPWAQPLQQQQSAYPPQDNKGAYQQPPGQFNAPGQLGQRQSQQPWLQRGSEDNSNSRPPWGPGGPQGRDSGNNNNNQPNTIVGRDRSPSGRFGGRDNDRDRAVGDGNRRPFDREPDRGNSRFDSGRGGGLGARIGGGGDSGGGNGGSRFDGGPPPRFGVDKERGSRFDDRECRDQDKERMDRDRDRGRRDREKGEDRYGRRADDRGDRAPRRSRFTDADDDRSGNANKEPLGRTSTNQTPRTENAPETTGALQEKMLAMAGMQGGPDGRVGAPLAVPPQRGGFRGPPGGRGGITGALNKRPGEDPSAGELKRSRFEDADDDSRKPWDGPPGPGGSSGHGGPPRGRGSPMMARGGPPLRGGPLNRGGPDGPGGPLGRGGMMGRGGPPGAPDGSSGRGGLGMRGGFGMRGSRGCGPGSSMVGHGSPMGLGGPPGGPGGPPGGDVGGPPPFEAGFRGGMRGCRGGPPNFMRGGRGVRGGPGGPMGGPGPDDGPFGGPPPFMDGPPPPWMNGPPGFGGDAPPMRGGRGGMRGGPGGRGGPSGGLGGGPRGMMRGGSRPSRGGFRGGRGMFGGGPGGAIDGPGGENDKDAGSFVDDDDDGHKGWGHARREQRGPETPTERPCARIVFEYGPPRADDALSPREESTRRTPPPKSSVMEMRRTGQLDFVNRSSQSTPVPRSVIGTTDDPRNAESLYSRRRSPSPNAVGTRTLICPALPQPRPRVRSASDIFLPPLRDSRPPFIALILRGLPGSGKSHLCRKLKELEAHHGAANEIRVMSIDDYYLVESEVEVALEDGCTLKKKELEYVHDDNMEPSYEASLLKAFTKQLETRHFSLLIVDAPNTRMNSVKQLATAAIEYQYTVLIMETEERDPKICYERNVHNRTLTDIEKMNAIWEDTTAVYVLLDQRSMRDSIIPQENINEHPNEPVHEDTMENSEVADNANSKGNGNRPANDEEEATSGTWGVLVPSRWEAMENTDEKLSRLDGGGYKKSSNSSRMTSMEEFLAVTEDYETRRSELSGGQKRVRWADIEERKQIERAKAIGFVVGQTNWTAFTNSETEASAALEKTKYFDSEIDE